MTGLFFIIYNSCNGFTTMKLAAISTIVISHEIGNAAYRTGSEWYCLNTVQIQIMRKAHVPITVMIAGSKARSVPLNTPAGISYRLHTGSKSRIHMIWIPALSITEGSVENSPEKWLRNITIGTVIMALNIVEKRTHNQSICLHFFLWLSA